MTPRAWTRIRCAGCGLALTFVPRIAAFLAPVVRPFAAVVEWIGRLSANRPIVLASVLLAIPLFVVPPLAWLVRTASQPLAFPAEMGRVGPISSIAWSNNGRYVAAGAHDGNIAVWDLADRQRVMHLRSSAPGAIMALRLYEQVSTDSGLRIFAEIHPDKHPIGAVDCSGATKVAQSRFRRP